MDFYEKKRRAGMDLKAWIDTPARDKFSEFTRRTLETYGFDRDYMLKLLEKTYPGLTIKDDRLEKV